MKLFPKSFRRRRLLGKRRHPKTFLFYQWLVFKHSLMGKSAISVLHALRHADAILPRLSLLGGRQMLNPLASALSLHAPT
ncbi:hypothetical protein FYB92_12055 [Novacetimonas sp. GS1]